MNNPLRVLIVEDSADDAEFLVRELARGGHDVVHERVETAEAMQAALARGTWDVILSDYSMPTFSGPEALAVMHETGCDLPFLIVSGTIGEETAVSAMKAGAHDFLVKGRLARLVPAIERELRDAAARHDRLRLEEHLRQAQKMEAIGQLAGGVAHDFNNVLTAILGFCELLLGEMALDAPARADLLEIQRAGERAAGLTRQLLAFSRQQVVQLKVHDLNALVSGVEPMLRRLIFENIELVVSLRSESGLIKIDATQLEQILVNLVVNARDAMPRGGTLTIETADAPRDDLAPRGQAPAIAGDYTVLAVRDTGVGMNEATRLRMFEPFFTTKGVGKGTGLGLATVHAIVMQNGGEIAVASQPDQGTTFTIYLPRVAEGTPSSPESRTAVEVRRGSETVLLVEDDPAVRLLAKVTLQRNGYHVLEAGDPQEAVRVASDYKQAIDLLLSDVIMPGSAGLPLIDRLSAVRPGLPVLYMSGYTDDAIVHHGVLDEETAFLQKPFTPHELAQKVREVLDARPGADHR